MSLTRRCCVLSLLGLAAATEVAVASQFAAAGRTSADWESIVACSSGVHNQGFQCIPHAVAVGNSSGTVLQPVHDSKASTFTHSIGHDFPILFDFKPGVQSKTDDMRTFLESKPSGHVKQVVFETTLTGTSQWDVVAEVQIVRPFLGLERVVIALDAASTTAQSIVAAIDSAGQAHASGPPKESIAAREDAQWASDVVACMSKALGRWDTDSVASRAVRFSGARVFGVWSRPSLGSEDIFPAANGDIHAVLGPGRCSSVAAVLPLGWGTDPIVSESSHLIPRASRLHQGVNGLVHTAYRLCADLSSAGAADAATGRCDGIKLAGAFARLELKMTGVAPESLGAFQELAFPTLVQQPELTRVPGSVEEGQARGGFAVSRGIRRGVDGPAPGGSSCSESAAARRAMVEANSTDVGSGETSRLRDRGQSSLFVDGVEATELFGANTDAQEQAELWAERTRTRSPQRAVSALARRSETCRPQPSFKRVPLTTFTGDAVDFGRELTGEIPRGTTRRLEHGPLELSDKERRTVTLVQSAIVAGRHGVSSLGREGLRGVWGMSGALGRHMLSNLCCMQPGTRYLEVGSYEGSTFLACTSGCPGHMALAVAVDNFSMGKDTNQERRRHAHIDWLVGGLGRTSVVAGDCHEPETVVAAGKQLRKLATERARVVAGSVAEDWKANVYMFDGPHEMEDQRDALTDWKSVLDDVFVLVVDDWAHEPVRDGTIAGLELAGMTVLYSEQLAPRWRHDPWWWNGYVVMVIRNSA